MSDRSFIEAPSYSEIRTLSEQYFKIIYFYQKKYPKLSDPLATELFIRKVSQDVRTNEELKSLKRNLHKELEEFITNNTDKIVEILNYAISLFTVNNSMHHTIRECFSVGIFSNPRIINLIRDIDPKYSI